MVPSFYSYSCDYYDRPSLRRNARDPTEEAEEMAIIWWLWSEKRGERGKRRKGEKEEKGERRKKRVNSPSGYEPDTGPFSSNIMLSASVSAASSER
jgi:hypothetical protein